MDYIYVQDCCEILDSMRVPITASERQAGPYPYYGANGIQDYVADYIFDYELVLLAEDGGNFGSKERPIAYRSSGKCWVNNHAHVLKPLSNFDADYVCYSLMFYDTTSLVNGATRQKLTQAAMRQMKIPKRTIQEQQKIVTLMNRVQSVIAVRKQQLTELDNLIKARFIELFGDPQSNPHEHKLVRLSDIATYFNGLTYKPENVAEDGTIVLRSSNIQNSQLDFEDTVRVDCAIKERLMVHENDILMCSRNGSAKLVGKVALIKGIQEPMSFGAFMMIIRSQYFGYLMTYFQMDAFRQQIKTGATTTINQITGRMLDDVTIPLPPMALVEQFTTFVEQTDKSKFRIQKSLSIGRKLWTMAQIDAIMSMDFSTQRSL